MGGIWARPSMPLAARRHAGTPKGTGVAVLVGTPPPAQRSAVRKNRHSRSALFDNAGQKFDSRRLAHSRPKPAHPKFEGAALGREPVGMGSMVRSFPRSDVPQPPFLWTRGTAARESLH